MRCARTVALLSCVLGAGCSAAEVDVTATFSSHVDENRLQRVRDLSVHVSGAHLWDEAVTLTSQARQEREIRFIYRARGWSGVVDLTLTARDEHQSPLAIGTAHGITLEPGRAVPAHVTLDVDEVTPGDDMGVPDDLSPVPDLAVPDDLHPSPSDGGPVVGGPSRCDAANVIFCDGFESQTIAPTKWSQHLLGATTLKVDSSRAYRGQFSLHVHMTPPQAGGYMHGYLTEIASTAPKTMFMRAFVWVASSTPRYNPTILLTAQQAQQTNRLADVALNETYMLRDGHNVPPGVYQQSGTALPLDDWACVEWQLSNDPSDGGTLEERVWISDYEVDGLHVANDGITPAFVTPGIGVMTIPPADSIPFDVWYDEIIIDDKRIGCAK